MSQHLRNVAIIAHVDHGKTTLVDALLQQSGTFRANQQVQERAMDSNDLERERGITILAKCTSVHWGDNFRFNIVDTPGHADFGGEVERILQMVDGVILLVDAAEGPMPQTKFVLGKALDLGFCPIVIVNKIDRPDGRPVEVQNEVFDLLLNLNATEEQLHFPILYASGRAGWAVRDLEKDERKDLTPLFELIRDHIPEPKSDPNAPFSFLATLLEADSYLGRILTGRILSGTAKLNMPVHALNPAGERIEVGRLAKIFGFRGLKREPIEVAMAGDLVAVAGFQIATVADTLCDVSVTTPEKARPIDPPSLAMTFSVNDSPLAGREGTKVTSRMIRDRLNQESEGNVAILIRESEGKDSYEVAGRGELQLGILIETMRREGFELSVSRPRVLLKKDENGNTTEPYEDVYVDVDEEFSGVVVEKLSIRKGELQEMRPTGTGKIRLVFRAPARGLIGYHGEFLADTKGTGVMNRSYAGYGPHKGDIRGRNNGVLISTGDGEAVAYAIFNLEDRGTFFIDPGTKVYQGMIIGENAKDNDMDVNPLKGKQLTNVRASGKDEAIRLTPPRKMTLEQALAYIEGDELVEVTPENIRIRKRYLDPNDRKRFKASASE